VITDPNKAKTTVAIDNELLVSPSPNRSMGVIEEKRESALSANSRKSFSNSKGDRKNTAESINNSLFLEGRKVPDYCNLGESKKFMQGVIIRTVVAKYKAEVGEFDAKGHTHTSESNYTRINDVYSLMWIDMLMAVPGVSEKKALAIFQHYRSLTKLMDGYKDQIDEESKIKMMTDIQVSKKFDSSSKARNLSKALSGRFYAVFQS
jgi:5'-3' exonuclease